MPTPENELGATPDFDPTKKAHSQPTEEEVKAGLDAIINKHSATQATTAAPVTTGETKPLTRKERKKLAKLRKAAERQTVIHKICTHPCSAVFQIGKVIYYGASGSRRAERLPARASLIRLAEDMGGAYWHRTGQAKLEVNDPAFEGLREHLRGAPKEIFFLDWQDYTDPPVRVEFWRELHKLLSKRGTKKEPHNAVFFCMGGHGRTGTALAAMLVANEGLSVHDALVKIRTSYCDEAVESTAQLEYLLDLDLALNLRPWPEALVKAREERIRTVAGGPRSSAVGFQLGHETVSKPTTGGWTDHDGYSTLGICGGE